MRVSIIRRSLDQMQGISAGATYYSFIPCFLLQTLLTAVNALCENNAVRRCARLCPSIRTERFSGFGSKLLQNFYTVKLSTKCEFSEKRCNDNHAEEGLLVYNRKADIYWRIFVEIGVACLLTLPFSVCEFVEDR
jgi:hypothetical protein